MEEKPEGVCLAAQGVPDGVNEGLSCSHRGGRFNVSSRERWQQGEGDAVMKTLHHQLGPLTCLAQLKQFVECVGAGSQQREDQRGPGSGYHHLSRS